MAPQRASLVRHASVLSSCLILLKTNSIGPFEPGSATLRPPQRAREQVQAVT